MSRPAAVAVLLVGVSGCAGCKADLPALTDANSGLDARCTGPFADLLVDSFPVALTNPAAALRAPDASTVSLTGGSVITVGFVGLGGVTDAPGNDLKIHATVEPTSRVTVQVASSDMVFRFSGDLTATATDVDVAVSDLSAAVYVRLIAVEGTTRVDALEATHDACR